MFSTYYLSNRYAWCPSEKKCFYLLAPTIDRGFVKGQIIFHGILCYIPFNLICNMTTFRKKTFWPHPRGQGVVLGKIFASMLLYTSLPYIWYATWQIYEKFILTRNFPVYETLCPQRLVCTTPFSPGNLFIILFQLTKSEATSCFEISLLEDFWRPNLHRSLIQKIISPGNLIITPISCPSLKFLDVTVTVFELGIKFSMTKFAKGNNSTKNKMIFFYFNQVIFSSLFSISWASLKLLAVTVFEISII